MDDKAKLKDISKTTTAILDKAKLTTKQRNFVEKYIENKVACTGKSATAIYMEANKNVTHGTAMTRASKTLSKDKIKNALEDVSSAIRNKYGFSQFCDSLTKIVHEDPDNKNKIAASRTMLQAVGAFNPTKKEVKLNINLDMRDVSEFSNTFSG